MSCLPTSCLFVCHWNDDIWLTTPRLQAQQENWVVWNHVKGFNGAGSEVSSSSLLFPFTFCIACIYIYLTNSMLWSFWDFTHPMCLNYTWTILVRIIWIGKQVKKKKDVISLLPKTNPKGDLQIYFRPIRAESSLTRLLVRHLWNF